jgi:hypothetical protein
MLTTFLILKRTLKQHTEYKNKYHLQILANLLWVVTVRLLYSSNSVCRITGSLSNNKTKTKLMIVKMPYCAVTTTHITEEKDAKQTDMHRHNFHNKSPLIHPAEQVQMINKILQMQYIFLENNLCIRHFRAVQKENIDILEA